MKTLLFVGNFGAVEIIIIAIIIVLLFGAKRIPELMKGVGKGVKNFKEGVKGDDDETSDKDSGDKDKI